MTDQAEQLREIMRTRGNGNNGASGGQAKKTRVITISSGKGGVGKTNIAINLAMAYSQLGKKVVVMDADLGLANVNVVLGIIPQVQSVPPDPQAEDHEGHYSGHSLRYADCRRSVRVLQDRQSQRR